MPVEITAEQNQLNKDIILAAIQSLDVSACSTPEDLARNVIKRSITFNKMLSDKSIQMRTLSAVRIYGKVKSCTFVESNQRYEIKYVAANSQDGTEEVLRSPRMDSFDGKVVKPTIDALMKKLAQESEVTATLYKFNEMPSENDRKANTRVPSAGYRTCVWIEMY